MITHSKATKDTAVDGRPHTSILLAPMVGHWLVQKRTVRSVPLVGYSGTKEWKRSRRGAGGAGMWVVSPAPAPARGETQGHVPRAGAPHHP